MRRNRMISKHSEGDRNRLRKEGERERGKEQMDSRRNPNEKNKNVATIIINYIIIYVTICRI